MGRTVVGMGRSNPRTAEIVAGNIDRLIEESGTTKNRVAADSGIPRQNLYRKLSKHPELFNLRELDNIAEALGVTVLDFLGAA